MFADNTLIFDELDEACNKLNECWKAIFDELCLLKLKFIAMKTNCMLILVLICNE